MVKKNSGMAIASLVLGICSLFLFWTFIVPILAVVFGGIALSQIKHNKKITGKSMAIWGIALGVFWFAILILFGMGWGIVNNLVDSDTKTGDLSSPSSFTIEELYIQQNLSLENVQVGMGYGEFDVPGYSPKKPTVEGKIRNLGDMNIESLEIVIYFLDSNGERIGEASYYPVNSFWEDYILKPNYVKDWGYIVDEDAPSDWSKKVEVEILEISFY